MDLVNKRDSSPPNPMHSRELAVNMRHARWEEMVKEQDQKQVFSVTRTEIRGNKEVEQKRRKGRGRLE